MAPNMPQNDFAPGCVERPLSAAPAQLLRAGLGEPIFLLSGSGDLRELDRLVAQLRTKRPLVGIAYWEAGADGEEPRSIEAMAASARNAIRAYQTHGRCTLVGYSTGGLVAVEIARLLTGEGQSVAPPILIDVIPPMASWPKRLFLQALPALAGKRVMRVIRERLDGGDKRVVGIDELAERIRLAYFNYRPRQYPGRVQLLFARNEFGYSPIAPKLWRRLAIGATSYPIDANRAEILRDDRAVHAVAQFIDEISESPRYTGETRSALLLTSHSWSTTTRLAGALIQAGFFLDAIAPSSHPLAAVKSLGTFYPLPMFRAKSAIEAAILDARPDILVPVDDFVTSILHDLHAETANGWLRSLIERSLGDPGFYAQRYNRLWMSELAARNGVLSPQTVDLDEKGTLAEALSQTGLPAFIKSDGSQGGAGVRRVETLHEAQHAFRSIRNAHRRLRAVKRAFLDGDVSGSFIKRRAHRFTAQSAIAGQSVIVSAVCCQGELLAVTSARVIAMQGSFGPATLIKFERLPIVDDAVARLARALGLSGLSGFDFILSEDNSQLWFIELNPRATPTCDLLAEGEPDLLGSFSPRRAERQSGAAIAFSKGEAVNVSGSGSSRSRGPASREEMAHLSGLRP